MIGPLILIAAIVSPVGSPTPANASPFRAIGGATARASASVRIVSGVSFGREQMAARQRIASAPGVVRESQVNDAEGQPHSALLLEFQ